MDDKKKAKMHPYRSLLDKIQTFDSKLIIAGVTVLCKDLAEYLAAGGFAGTAAEGFMRVYAQSLHHDRWFWERYGPQLYWSMRPAAPAPPGDYDPAVQIAFNPPLPSYAHEASQNDFDLHELNSARIDQNWTLIPGWQLFNAFLEAHASVLSKYKTEINALPPKPLPGDPTPYPDTDYKVLKIFDVLREKVFDRRLHWIPLAMYLSYLIVDYCPEWLHEESNALA
ncbi:MAG: hypothetical protein IT259_11170 [Saprospiraceae bacterium]|nr:hypothetical protein [Saprospiraceae bacterium]